MAEAIPTEWEVVPGVAGSAEAGLQAIAQRCRRKVTKNALFAAGVAVVPVPVSYTHLTLPTSDLV